MMNVAALWASTCSRVISCATGDRQGRAPPHVETGRAPPHRRLSGPGCVGARCLGHGLGRSFADLQSVAPGEFRLVRKKPADPFRGGRGHLDGHGLPGALGHSVGASLGTRMPGDVFGTALQRGYMCESLATMQGDAAPGSSFLVACSPPSIPFWTCPCGRSWSRCGSPATSTMRSNSMAAGSDGCWPARWPMNPATQKRSTSTASTAGVIRRLLAIHRPG